MKIIPKNIERLIDEFSKLPGIGPKAAQRIAFSLLKKPNQDLITFSEAILNLKKGLKICPTCSAIIESTCEICSSPKRDKALICVVEKATDIIHIEKTGFRGLYHVLHGTISPIDGQNPENLYIKPLVARMKKVPIKEIILAMNPSVEGETTALYLKKILAPFKIKITRLGFGLPMGAELEYADEITLRNSLEGRKEY